MNTPEASSTASTGKAKQTKVTLERIDVNDPGVVTALARLFDAEPGRKDQTPIFNSAL
ncbi:hypothetical protein [Streptomyces sp. NPDC092307]|uniref:hypothetical protein n=1 Tax=Streptomyces sp. NPDC092307 TaxID=3366013 RepID=UPI0037F98E5D